MIKAQNISFSYTENIPFINNLSAEFKKGEICAVLGVNGGGKTTVLRLLARLSSPDSGEIYLDDRPYSEYKRKEFARKTAFLPQFRDIPAVTVYEFVCHGRFPHIGFSGILNKADKKIVDNALEITHCSHLRRKELRAISGGERQRVYIAMLIAQNSDYIILDEPATYMDICYRFEILNLLNRLKDMGKGIIFSLHDLSSALKISDKTLLLENGNLVQYGTTEEILKSGNIEKVFKVKCTQIKIENETEYVFTKNHLFT